jgi:hypothetical protein
VEISNEEKRKRPRKRYTRTNEAIFVQNKERIAKDIEASGSMIHAFETIWSGTLNVSYEQFTRYVRKHIRAPQMAAESAPIAVSTPQILQPPQPAPTPSATGPAQPHEPRQGRPAGTRTFRHNPDDMHRGDLI